MAITARQIHEHLRAVGTWVDWEGGTCDGFKYGDPDTQVRGIAVGWQALQGALEQAYRMGCNLFITHEPTFYTHSDDDDRLRNSEPGLRKRRFLDSTGMVVYRCHDVWDVFPGIGVLDSWADYLDLGTPLTRDRYHSVHAVPKTTAWELVQRIAERVRPLGEQSVRFIGCKWQMVSRLAIGTGAITRVHDMLALGADAILATDDGISIWRDGSYLSDLSIPLMLVNHSTAEVPGLYHLVDYLRQQFPGVQVEFVGPTCTYEIMATERSRETPLRMRLDTLESLPPVSLPEGYTLRPMAPDEVWAYLEVMNRSNFAGQADDAWFQRTFADDTEYDPAHLQIIWKGERPVAAAAAWHNEIEGAKWGMVHWVGVVNDERGKGLSKAVVLAVLHRLRARGFERAMLNTHSWRLAAVAAYMRLGFQPWPTEQAPQQVWERVLDDMADWRDYGRPRRFDE